MSKKLNILSQFMQQFSKFTLISTINANNSGYVMLIISQIQILSLILEQLLYFLNEDSDYLYGIYAYLIYFTNPTYIFIQSHIKVYSIMIIYTLIAIFLLFLFFILFYFKKFINANEEETRSNELWGFICIFHEKYLFLIIFRNSFSLIILNIQEENSDSYAYAMILIIINLINMLFAGWLCYITLPTMQFQFKHSMKSRILNWINLSYKVITVLIIHFYDMEFPFKRWIGILFQFVYLIVTFYYVFITLLFYSIETEKIIGILIGNTFILTLISSISMLLEEKTIIYNWRFYIWLLSIPFVIKLTINILDLKRYKLVEGFSKDTINEDSVLTKLIHGGDLFNRKESKFNANTFKYLNFSARYLNIQYNEINKDDDENLTIGNDEKCLCTIMNIIYEQGITKFPNSIRIRMIYLNFLLSYNSKSINPYASVIIISQLYQIIKENDYFRRIYLLVLQQCYDARTRVISKNIKEGDNMSIDDDNNFNKKAIHNLNIMEYNILNKKIEQIKNYIDDALIKYLQFWDKFNHESSIHSNLLSYSLEINQKYQKIIKILDNIVQNKDNPTALVFSKSLLYISIFSITVRFSTIESERCMEIYNYIQKKIEKLYNIEELNSENLYANNNIFITISGVREYLGQILTCSPWIQKYLGYDPQSLITRNISMILPPFFQKRHDQYLTNFLNTGRSYGLNSITLRPTVHEDQSIVLVDLFIQVISTLESGLLFLGVLRPICSMNQIITLTHDGMIDGMSVSLRRLLDLNSKNMQISFLKFTEGYSIYHNALNFLRFIDLIMLNLEKSNENLIKICENFQSYAYDEIEIINAYQTIKNLICTYNREDLKKYILKMTEYAKIKTFCDKFTLEEINFSIKLSETKYCSVKSYIEDQLYQNNEFLRILKIQDLKVNIEITPKTSLFKPSKFSIPYEESSISQNIERNECPSLNLLNSITKYNKYHKKTKYNIDHETDNLNSDQQSFQFNKLSSRDSKLYTLTKRNHNQRRSSFKSIDITKFNDENACLGSLTPVSHNLLLTSTKKITNRKIDQINDQLNNIPKSSNHSIEFNTNRIRKLSSSASVSTLFTHNYIEKKVTQAFDYIYVSNLSKFMTLTFGIYTLFAIIIGIFTYENQLSIGSNFLQDASALYYWNMAYKRLLDLSYVAKDLLSVQTSLMPNDAWAFSDAYDDAEYDIVYIGGETSLLKDLIDNFGKSIYSLPSDLKNQILQTPIRLYDVDPITFELGPNYTTRNIIGASYEFVNAVLAIGSIPLEKKFNLTPEIIYLTNNICVDMIQAHKNINEILLKVITDQYSESQYIKLVICIVLICFSIICLFILQYQGIVFFKIQYQFLDNLAKLKSWKTTLIQKNIEKLSRLIKIDSFNESLIDFKKNIEREYRFKEKLVEDKEKFQHQARYVKVHGSLITKRNYLKGFIGLGYVCGFIALFLANYLNTNEIDNKNQQNIQRFLHILSRYSNISLSASQFYTYLATQGNGTFYDKLLSQDLDALLQTRSVTTDLVSLFMNEYQSLEYSQYLTGNACQIIDPSMELFCMEWGQQVNQYGIFAMEQWAGRRLIMLKQSFDTSNRSIEISKEIFKSLTFLEVLAVDFYIQPVAYEGLNAAIKHDIDHGINNGQIYNIEFISMLLVISALEVLIFGFVIIKRAYYEYMELKTLLRMFPTSISLKHPYFKNFICQTSNPVLGNIRNILLQHANCKSYLMNIRKYLQNLEIFNQFFCYIAYQKSKSLCNRI